MFELCHIRNQFQYGVDPARPGRRCSTGWVGSAAGGITPEISPESPTGEIFRYMLGDPKDRRAARSTSSTT